MVFKLKKKDISKTGIKLQYLETRGISFSKKMKKKTSWGWAEPSSAKAGAMDSVEIRLKIDV